jgi:Transglutaminase-like superfamily
MLNLDTNDLAWCEIDGKLVFLDIGNDRYFKLADNQNQVAVDRIRRSGLPEWHQPERLPRPSTLSPQRTSNAIENGRFNLSEVARAMWIQRRVERRLARHGFASVLSDLYRTVNSRSARSDIAGDAAQKTISAFQHSKLIRTAADRCLPRSIALALCLAARRVRAHVVIGVRIEPFGAHCWVQAGNEVLNESVEEVLLYTPILAI